MTDREALAAAFKRIDGKVESKADWLVVHAAAKRYFAQLPEKCERCNGDGLIDFERDEYGNQIGPQEEFCPSCHGSGRVYPAELVERIAKAIWQVVYPKIEWEAAKPASRKFYAIEAAAVLDALNGETP